MFFFCLPRISLERYCQKNVKVGGFGKVNKAWYGCIGEVSIQAGLSHLHPMNQFDNTSYHFTGKIKLFHHKLAECR